MTTATINNKKVSLSIEEKATLLTVLEVAGIEGYIVPSGSDEGKAYQVSADAQQCNCPARGTCAHQVAVLRYKMAQQAANAGQLFSTVCGHRVKHNIHRHCGCQA